MKRPKTVWVGLAVLATTAIYLNNTSILASAPSSGPTLLAHRGLAQTFDPTGVTATTCTASRMRPPTHDYLENTIASMKAAFELGADVVEFDVHPTPDGQFAVFHDWALDCRTNGHGVTREHSLRELKTLDIGYGYTADGGKTFPFRGRGIGLMPSLTEVLATFPDKALLINVKSNDPSEGDLLAEAFGKLPPERLTRLMAYGGDAPIARLHERLPSMRTMSRASAGKCALHYVLTGWMGYVPDACRNLVLLVPSNIGPWLWGWPHRFQERMAGASTSIFAVGRYSGGGFSSGIDDRNALSDLPSDYKGGIATDRVDVLSKLVRK